MVGRNFKQMTFKFSTSASIWLLKKKEMTPNYTSKCLIQLVINNESKIKPVVMILIVEIDLNPNLLYYFSLLSIVSLFSI